jgi:hypothetical protein
MVPEAGAGLAMFDCCGRGTAMPLRQSGNLSLDEVVDPRRPGCYPLAAEQPYCTGRVSDDERRIPPRPRDQSALPAARPWLVGEPGNNPYRSAGDAGRGRPAGGFHAPRRAPPACADAMGLDLGGHGYRLDRLRFPLPRTFATSPCGPTKPWIMPFTPGPGSELRSG